MAQLPDDFLSWKSLRSLTTTACVAWAIVLVIDVIFISTIHDPFSQLKWIWAVGFMVCFALASIRLYFKQEKEKGDTLFLIFNAALIFLYASGFNGFTKELGSWSELQNEIARKPASKPLQNTRLSILLAGWIPSVFANQTAYWPDAKLIANNKYLQSRNKKLEDSLQVIATGIGKQVQYLTDQNNQLVSDNKQLLEELQILMQNVSRTSVKTKNATKQIETLANNMDRLQSDNQRLVEENQQLRNKVSSSDELIKENEALYGQIKILLERINKFNARQAAWNNVNPGRAKRVKELVTSAIRDDGYYDFLFRTKIDNSVQLPGK